MPRNLEEDKSAGVPLTQSPDKVPHGPNHDGVFSAYPKEFVIVPEEQQQRGPPNLHPYTRPLTISDWESSVAIDAAAFINPEERASKEKVSLVIYPLALVTCSCTSARN